MDQRPKNGSVKDEIISIWDLKVSKVVSCYEKYVTTADGGGALDGGMIHTDKWYPFHSKLQSWEASPNHYSLHYKRDVLFLQTKTQLSGYWIKSK